jgi:hypothetical protein
MYFPGNFKLGSIPMRYVHFMQAVTRDVAVSFTRSNIYNFQIQSLTKVQGGYFPICSFLWAQEFDELTPIYH